MKLYYAKLETRYLFEGYGRTRDEALRACRRAWILHARQAGPQFRTMCDMYRWRDLEDAASWISERSARPTGTGRKSDGQ